MSETMTRHEIAQQRTDYSDFEDLLGGTPLYVPPHEEQEALDAGALFAKGDQFFVARNFRTMGFEKWLLKNTELTIEMLPKVVHGKNVRSMMGRTKWDRIRNYIYKKHGMACVCCGGRGSSIQRGKKWVEAHEQWSFDESTRTMTLTDILCLCPDCHLTQHTGFARKKGWFEQVMKHYIKVKGCTPSQATKDYFNAQSQAQHRDSIDWKIDISLAEKILSQAS